MEEELIKRIECLEKIVTEQQDQINDLINMLQITRKQIWFVPPKLEDE